MEVWRAEEEENTPALLLSISTEVQGHGGVLFLGSWRWKIPYLRLRLGGFTGKQSRHTPWTYLQDQEEIWPATTWTCYDCTWCWLVYLIAATRIWWMAWPTALLTPFVEHEGVARDEILEKSLKRTTTRLDGALIQTVINISDLQLNETKTAVLARGRSSRWLPKRIPVENIIANVEVGLKMASTLSLIHI